MHVSDTVIKLYVQVTVYVIWRSWVQTPVGVELRVRSTSALLLSRTWTKNRVYFVSCLSLGQGLPLFQLDMKNNIGCPANRLMWTISLRLDVFTGTKIAVLDLGFDQGGGIPHQAEKGGGIWQLGGGVFWSLSNQFSSCDYFTYFTFF